MASSPSSSSAAQPLPDAQHEAEPPSLPTTTTTHRESIPSHSLAELTMEPSYLSPSITTATHQENSPSHPPPSTIIEPSHPSPPSTTSPSLPSSAPFHPPPSTTSLTSTSTLSPSLPQNPALITQARTALLASIGNMLDSSLRDRASVLHQNADAISRQERDVARATSSFKKENDALLKLADDGARRVKELGNVQNWAEVLERDFLVLEETLRLVRRGSEGSWSGSGSENGGSWSGSESGEEGDVDMDRENGKGKGKEIEEDRMDIDGPELGGRYTTGGGSGSAARIEPSINVPGLESAESKKSMLEDELRRAMSESIGEMA